MSPIDSNAFASNLAPYVPRGDELDGERFRRAWSTSPPAAENTGFGAWGLEPIAAEPFEAPSRSGPTGPDASIGSLMNGLMAALSNLVDRLGALLQGAGDRTGGPAPGAGQRFFQDASASSVGDPHDALTGTTGEGHGVSKRWDDVQGHPDLLDSDSFAGGYRVSTSITPPGASGVTQNQSATVSLDSGASSATLNHDGSYSVVSQGRNLTLEASRPTPLGSGATVTLNADRSLRVDDRSADGGDLGTTLRPNGSGGVDVTSDAHRVDLGGYLLHGTGEAAGPTEPVGQPPLHAVESTWPPRDIQLA
ncbi:MAG: hypothetical protein M3R53_00315 [Candidatus Eremiobacteraeota bacterium]|nr:hypothetical protein [Candidatus Eremiobacteraeota bacterium]